MERGLRRSRLVFAWESGTPLSAPVTRSPDDQAGGGPRVDNALAETVNGLYKAELVYRERPWTGADDLELATLGWVDWFNHTRLPSSLSYRTPAEVETEYHRHNQSLEHQPAGQPTA